jgi:glycosyltransferase involved in cell wall biosynthesis
MVANSPITIRCVYESKPGVAAARNRGLAEARGPWIAFCDDDQQVDDHWLLELLRMARRKEVRVVGGAVRLDLPPDMPRPPLAIRRSFGESLHSHPHPYTKKVSPGTGNLLIHQTVIEQVGHFDERLREAGEDTDLFRRIREAGIDAWYTPQAVVWHHTPLYRLQADYQRWSAHRTGWVFADRDQKERGLTYLLAMTVARIAQAAVVRWPQLVWAKAKGDPWSGLGARCYLWRCEGYVRRALHATGLAWCRQDAFERSIEFRSERAFFDSASETNVSATAGEAIPALSASAESSE